MTRNPNPNLSVPRKLDPDKVREIRRRRAAGEKLSVLAAEFGVGESVISRTCARIAWKHVADAPVPA